MLFRGAVTGCSTLYFAIVSTSKLGSLASSSAVSPALKVSLRQGQYLNLCISANGRNTIFCPDLPAFGAVEVCRKEDICQAGIPEFFTSPTIVGTQKR